MIEFLAKYRYAILFSGFALWMLFFDSNNLFYRYRISQEIGELEETKANHANAITALERQKKDLFSGNLRNLEKFAREKYLMKKDNEDLFIIVKTESEKD